MYAWALQIKVPTDPVWYYASYRAPGDSRSLCVVRVHGRHPHIIFQHGRRKDCSAGAFKTLDGDARCKKNIVSIWFFAVPSVVRDSLPTFLEGSVRRLECPSLHRVHGLGLFRGHRKERSVKGSDIIVDKVPAAAIELMKW